LVLLPASTSTKTRRNVLLHFFSLTIYIVVFQKKNGWPFLFSFDAICFRIRGGYVLALKYAGITLFHKDFIHMTAANIDLLQYVKSGDLVPLELNFKMILRAFLAFYHHESHKKRGGINILDATAVSDYKSRLVMVE